MLSASAVDGIWRACLFKLSKLLPLDASRRRRRRRRKKNEEEQTTKTAIDVRSTSDDDDENENDSQNHSDDEDTDDLTVYLRYLAILDRLNLCERSCVHPQKHRLIDRLMSLAYFRVSTLRREIEQEEDEEIFETETVDERLRHRNEAKESGEMVVPERFRRERRRFLMEEVTRVVEKARADLASLVIIETAKDDASEEEEKKADEEEKTDETSDKETDGEGDSNVTEMEECEEEEEKEEEEEVKEKRASSAEYADAHRKAVVHMQRHARGCLARKKMRKKAEEELERLGMLVPSDERRMKSRKTTMNICVDSSGSAAAGSENEEEEEEEEDIETKIERTRNERLREYLQNQPRVYEQTKKALLEEHSRESVLALETFVREYRETHEGAAPAWKDVVNDAESNGDDAESHRSVLRLLEATENSESDNDDNDDDRKCGFEALRKILAESERAFPSTRIDDDIDDENDERARERRRDENNRERRCTRFSERAEKSAIEKKILKEVSMEIKENVKLALDEMRAKDASSSSPSTRREEGENAKTKSAVATKKEKKKKNDANGEVEDEKKKKNKNKKTDKKSIKANKKSSSASSAAAAQRETALYDSIDAYPMTKYLLENNVQIDATCATNNENNEKFIASGADEFAYGVPEEEEAVKPDRSIDDQRRAIESIKSNVLIPLGASGASDAWMESFRAHKPKHLLFVGPRGCGQKHFAKNVLARETGSVFFDASIENVSRRMKMTTDNENDNDTNNISDSTLPSKDHDNDNGKDEEIAFCADLLKQTFQLAKKWAPSVVYVGNIEDAFATGKQKKKKNKKSNKTKTKGKSSAKTNENDEEDEKEEKINTDSVAIAVNTGTDGRTQREAPARRLKKIDAKSFKSALTAALKSLEKENSCSRRVCVVASISDASRLTKKDEKSLFGKIFHSKDAFVAPFMRPSRAARYDLLKTFYREIADEYTDTFEKCNALSMKTSKSSKIRVADGARDEGAVSELSHFSETCNRKVLKLCVREGFRKAAEYIASSSSSSSSSPSDISSSSAKSRNRGECIIQPRAFTDSQRALVWRFASEHLRTLREETQKRIVEEEEEEEEEARDNDEFFANEENDAVLRAFAKRVCLSSSSSSSRRRR